MVWDFTSVTFSNLNHFHTPTREKKKKKMSAASLVSALRQSFNSGVTKTAEWRRTQLLGLLKLIDENIPDILSALKSDLNKCEFESFLFEIDITRNDIVNHLNNLTDWMKPTSVKKGLFFTLDTCQIKPEPFGVVLIISPWNYPLHLILMPLIGAISAGNCVFLKPSELAPSTGNLISKLIPKYLDENCFKVMLGGVDETTQILLERFDHILYTGSTNVGKIVMGAAAKYLTPVTLELGGKNPVYVDKNCNLQTVANRLMWAKCVNVGQTCIAPDYVMCSPEIQAPLVEAMKASVKKFYGEDIAKSDSYGRIINDKHFKRIQRLLKDQTPAFGGETNEAERFIAPTVITDVKKSDLIMEEEIFGPILPMMLMDNVDEVIRYINDREKPLAVYVFSSDKKIVDRFLAETTSGGVCVNDCILQVALETLPFGGVGNSGMGSYHGKFSFDTFSHKKAIMWKSQGLESLNDLRYPPFTTTNLNWIRRLTRKSLKRGSLFMISLMSVGLLGLISIFIKKSDLHQMLRSK